MPSPYGLGRGFGQYVSDDGNTYVVGSTADNLAAGGFTIVAPGSGAALPRGYVMRHVYGVNGAGQRTKIPIASPASSTFTTGGSVTKTGGPYIVEGRIGEKRSFRS